MLPRFFEKSVKGGGNNRRMEGGMTKMGRFLELGVSIFVKMPYICTK